MHIVNEGNGMYGIERDGRRVQATQGMPSECDEVQESLPQSRVPRVRYEGISSQGHVFISVDGNAGAIDCGPATPETIRLARVMAAGAELLDALRDLQKELRAVVKFDVRKHYSLMVRDAAASTAIARAEGTI